MPSKITNKSVRLVVLMALTLAGELDSKTLQQLKDAYFPGDSTSTLSRSIADLADLRLAIAKLITPSPPPDGSVRILSLLLAPLDPQVRELTHAPLEAAIDSSLRIARIAARLEMDPAAIAPVVSKYLADQGLTPRRGAEFLTALIQLEELAKTGSMPWDHGDQHE